MTMVTMLTMMAVLMIVQRSQDMFVQQPVQQSVEMRSSNKLKLVMTVIQLLETAVMLLVRLKLVMIVLEQDLDRVLLNAGMGLS